MIINHVLLALLLGVATYAMANTVTNHEGPFHVFGRIRDLLLPQNLRPVCFDTDIYGVDITDIDIQDGYYNLIESYEKEIAFVVALLEYDDNFNNTLRGTLFNILNCKYCFGVYAALGFSLTMTFVFFGFSVITFIIALFHWWVAIGLQRLIIAIIDGVEE